MIRGRDAIVEHMSGPGPGKVVHWDAKEWPSGLAATFEWRGGSGVDRRRWYVRAEEGKIVGWWSYAARPKDLAAAEIPERVLASLGSGARRATLDHGGNSGAAIERVDFPDGRTLIGKRVGPAADWLGRVTGDRGRTALLWLDGAFSRIPGSLDHGIEAVVQDGDGWWVLMRDLSATFLGDTRMLTAIRERAGARRGRRPPLRVRERDAERRGRAGRPPGDGGTSHRGGGARGVRTSCPSRSKLHGTRSRIRCPAISAPRSCAPSGIPPRSQPRSRRRDRRR